MRLNSTKAALPALWLLAALLLASAAAPSLQAQKKAKSEGPVYDGTSVYLSQDAPAIPVESRMGEDSNLAIDFPPTKTIYLYPRGQRFDLGIVEDGKQVTLGFLGSNGVKGPEQIDKNGFLTEVGDSARIDIYLPGRCDGQMAIICPGGGYGFVSTLNEGIYVAKWLNDRGVAAAVVKYRLPHGRHGLPLRDVQNAFRYCRHHSAEWGVRQIGVIGFSAGGHLAASAQTMYVDAATKPDFAVLVYPVITFDDALTHKGTKHNLLGGPESQTCREDVDYALWRQRTKDYAALTESYSLHNNVTPTTSPTFIALCDDDKAVPSANSILMYSALQRNKVPVEMHLYPRGGHGWGFNDLSLGLDPSKVKDAIGEFRPEFSAALERWLLCLREPAAKAGPRTGEQLGLEPTKTVLLYPQGQGVDKGIAGITLGPCESNGASGPETSDPDLRLKNVGDSARFDLYLAPEPNGKMVIVCPGGGYSITATSHEGSHVAKWLNSLGVSAAVVKYRLPLGHWTVPLTDVQNTFRYCRHFAKEWGIDKIGVMGFSAGGHLAATASTMYVDPVTRPDFSILVYPVISSELAAIHSGTFRNLIGTKEKWYARKGLSFEEWTSRRAQYDALLERYSPDKQVSSDTPPTYMVFSSDDAGVDPRNDILYYEALHRCGVRCEMHAYPSGGHGWGFKNYGIHPDPIQDFRQDFLASLARFLKGM